ncbi:phosphatase PAP2 family protein [Marinifilum caeruleilacunae]|uniref:Phosphatase PAP2 family protein n=1 Tax=Marinifilum caeruleilacunae TaxID=2499076 RepID=A0ABX1WS00_9BACT|nr:phosphatase PAP2 family protein [Marinifilum caeruleilacunae]NOU58872.1 phosphatase PAP2 family protein [Marinifilum caeruleilacunae]
MLQKVRRTKQISFTSMICKIKFIPAFICIVLIHLSHVTHAQYSDYYTFEAKKEKKKKSNMPLTIAGGVIGAGLLLEYSGVFNKSKFQDQVLYRFPNVTTSIDDYFQYTPIAIGMGLNAFGVRGEHKFTHQLKRLAFAEAICNATVFTIKTQTKHTRPDGSAANSFPSGHTAQAFCAAAFLDREYGKKYPWLRWLGYGMATTTGVCRILKNRHWASDVVLGAGIGYLSVDLSYRLFDRWERNKNLQITPMVGNKTYGLNVVYRF